MCNLFENISVWTFGLLRNGHGQRIIIAIITVVLSVSGQAQQHQQDPTARPTAGVVAVAAEQARGIQLVIAFLHGQLSKMKALCSGWV